MVLRLLPLIPLILAGGCLWAQTSTNYAIEQGTFNNGGNPAPVLTSDHYQMTLDAIGDALSGTGLASASYGMDAGFPPAYPPPGEVLNLRWTDKTTLAWDPYPKMTLYNIYWGDLNTLSGGYGACLDGDIAGLTLSSVPPPHPGGSFFLVTTENSLEEGTLGTDSSGVRRPLSSPCE